MAEITESRACVDQTKGMLMLIYGVDDDAAFNLLKWLSHEANVKLRLVQCGVPIPFDAAQIIPCGPNCARTHIFSWAETGRIHVEFISALAIPSLAAQWVSRRQRRGPLRLEPRIFG